MRVLASIMKWAPCCIRGVRLAVWPVVVDWAGRKHSGHLMWDIVLRRHRSSQPGHSYFNGNVSTKQTLSRLCTKKIVSRGVNTVFHNVTFSFSPLSFTLLPFPSLSLPRSPSCLYLTLFLPRSSPSFLSPLFSFFPPSIARSLSARDT